MTVHLPPLSYSSVNTSIFKRISFSVAPTVGVKIKFPLRIRSTCVVATEPCLQPLSGENLRLASANANDGARLDVRARGFWSVCQDAFFDVRVFHPNASSNRSGKLSAVYKRHEDAKKREYGQRVLDVEHGVFTPLVLSTTGGMGREATTFYKRLADMLSSKRNLPYSTLMGWLRCKISFAILRSAVMCIRGSRSSKNHAVRDTTYIALACSEGCVPQQP